MSIAALAHAARWKIVAVAVAVVLAAPGSCAAIIATSLWDTVSYYGDLVEVKLPDGRSLRMRYDLDRIEMRKQIAAELQKISDLADEAVVLERLWGKSRDMATIIDEAIGHAWDATIFAAILWVLTLATLAWAFVPRAKQTQHNREEQP